MRESIIALLKSSKRFINTMLNYYIIYDGGGYRILLININKIYKYLIKETVIALTVLSKLITN